MTVDVWVTVTSKLVLMLQHCHNDCTGISSLFPKHYIFYVPTKLLRSIESGIHCDGIVFCSIVCLSVQLFCLWFCLLRKSEEMLIFATNMSIFVFTVMRQSELFGSSQVDDKAIFLSFSVCGNYTVGFFIKTSGCFPAMFLETCMYL